MPNPGQPTIGPGATGDHIQRLQRALRRALRSDLAVDGTFGPATEAAVKQFQKVAKLKVDGNVGEDTWNALPDGDPMPTLKKGATGLLVARLQNVLAHGAPGQWEKTPGPIDEHFGPKTTACVKAFQSWAGIPANGTVDDRTWSVSIPAMNGTLETVVGPEHALR